MSPDNSGTDYATGWNSSKPLYLIDREYVLYEPVEVCLEDVGIGRTVIYWEAQWQFQTKEQAIRDAEIRHQNELTRQEIAATLSAQ